MLNDTQPYIIVMDTLLKETVDLTVNSRYPGMAPEGRRQIEEILIRKEVEDKICSLLVDRYQNQPAGISIGAEDDKVVLHVLD